MNCKLRTLVGASLAIVAFGTGVAVAAKLSPADAVANRRSSFRDLAASNKVITDELKKPAPDKAIMERAAMEIHEFGRVIQGTLFEKGTGKESDAPTRAKDEIWGDPKSFLAQQAAFSADADKLYAAAKAGDIAAITETHKAVGAQCAACHAKYRE